MCLSKIHLMFAVHCLRMNTSHALRKGSKLAIKGRHHLQPDPKTNLKDLPLNMDLLGGNLTLVYP